VMALIGLAPSMPAGSPPWPTLACRSLAVRSGCLPGRELPWEEYEAQPDR